jgi:hypothetical protein
MKVQPEGCTCAWTDDEGLQYLDEDCPRHVEMRAHPTWALHSIGSSCFRRDCGFCILYHPAKQDERVGDGLVPETPPTQDWARGAGRDPAVTAWPDE